MKKVLITGATGFIGSYLLKQLQAQGHSIRVLTRNTDVTFADDIDVVFGDLSIPQTLKNCCENIETVFHLGGFAHAWAEDDPALAQKHHNINYLGTRNLYQEASSANVKRFIFFSSVKAVADSEHCIDEKWINPPDSPYGKAKRDAERFLLAAAQLTNTDVCILRPALVYGTGWKGNLAAMLRAIDKGYFIPVPAISNRRSMISVADISNAAILCASHPDAVGKIFFVTDNISYSTRYLYTAICSALNKPIPKWHMPLAGFKVLGWSGDIAQKILRKRMPFSSQGLLKLFGSAEYSSQRIQIELGFKPAYSLENYLPEIVAAYQAKNRHLFNTDKI